MQRRRKYFSKRCLPYSNIHLLGKIWVSELITGHSNNDSAMRLVGRIFAAMLYEALPFRNYSLLRSLLMSVIPG